MFDQDFTTTFLVDQTPEEAFAAINNVRGWWSVEIDGNTDKLGAEFKYHYQDVHRCTFKITEFVPGKKVVCHVWTTTSTLFRTKPSGQVPMLSLKLPKRAIKRKCTLPTLGLCLPMSATMFAQTHGVRT